MAKIKILLKRARAVGGRSPKRREEHSDQLSTDRPVHGGLHPNSRGEHQVSKAGKSNPQNLGPGRPETVQGLLGEILFKLKLHHFCC